MRAQWGDDGCHVTEVRVSVNSFGHENKHIFALIQRSIGKDIWLAVMQVTVLLEGVEMESRIE